MTEPVLIVGAGIAGLTAALSLAKRGVDVHVVEQAARLEEVGAGLQLSPNATRIIADLGLAEPLRAVASRPERVALVDARTGCDLAAVRLGAWAETRWGAPYYALHRADLQRVLFDAALDEPRITLSLGSRIDSLETKADRFRVAAAGHSIVTPFVIGADGVRSRLRQWAGGKEAQPSGFTAWRGTFSANALRDLPASPDQVTAFLHPRVHCIAYPVRGGAEFNLAGFSTTRGACGGADDFRAFSGSFSDALPALARLAGERERWSAWDVRMVRPFDWGRGNALALIGDAAHATTPFAAQGGAMAIEDAASLASAIASGPAEGVNLDDWRQARSTRLAHVIKRGRLNQLAWHVSGPTAWARNFVLASRSPERLAADLDWLYGWRMDEG
ncbi:MAG: FAD-dependent monooxygenase [Methylobacterium mesophilicum]|nr:FAD-dependent monooxygenase [Methylobacterium mesophilicum]